MKLTLPNALPEEILNFQINLPPFKVPSHCCINLRPGSPRSSMGQRPRRKAEKPQPRPPAVRRRRDSSDPSQQARSQRNKVQRVLKPSVDVSRVGDHEKPAQRTKANDQLCSQPPCRIELEVSRRDMIEDVLRLNQC